MIRNPHAVVTGAATKKLHGQRDQAVCEIRSSWPGWEYPTDVHNANTILRHLVEHTVLIEA